MTEETKIKETKVEIKIGWDEVGYVIVGLVIAFFLALIIVPTWFNSTFICIENVTVCTYSSCTGYHSYLCGWNCYDRCVKFGVKEMPKNDTMPSLETKSWTNYTEGKTCKCECWPTFGRLE